MPHGPNQWLKESLDAQGLRQGQNWRLATIWCQRCSFRGIRLSAYNAVEHKAWLILFHPFHHRLLGLSLHGGVDEQPWFTWLFLQNFQRLVIVCVLID